MLLPLVAVTMMLGLTRCAPAQNNVAYVVKSSDGKSLTFYYDTFRAWRKGLVFGIDSSKIVNSDTFPAWTGSYYGPDTMIVKVKFDSSFKDFRPKSTSRWFLNMIALRRITGIENLNTYEVTNMSSMFSGCSALANLDLSGFDTRNVTGMGSMFFGCSTLANLDLSGFDTRNVTDMSCMFADCSSLTKLYLTKFNTRNDTDIRNMFDKCNALSDLYCNDERISKLYSTLDIYY